MASTAGIARAKRPWRPVGQVAEGQVPVPFGEPKGIARIDQAVAEHVNAAVRHTPLHSGGMARDRYASSAVAPGLFRKPWPGSSKPEATRNAPWNAECLPKPALRQWVKWLTRERPSIRERFAQRTRAYVEESAKAGQRVGAAEPD